MILKFFNEKFIIVQFGIIGLLLLNLLSNSIILYEPQSFGPLYNLIYQGIKDNSMLISISFIALVITEGFLLQLIAMYYNLIPRNNFLIPFVWLILVNSNPAVISINPVIIAAVVATWALFRLMSTSDIENTLPSLFSAGFTLSIASLIYGNMIWYAGFLILSLLFLSLFRAREVIVSFISFSIPYLYLLSYGFVMDIDYTIWHNFHSSIGEWTFFSEGIQLWISLFIALIILILSLFGVLKIMFNLFSKLIQIRKFTSLLFAFLITNFILQFIAGPWWFAHPIIIFVPLTILLSIYLSEQKKTFYLDLILWLLIILEVVQSYYTNYA